MTQDIYFVVEHLRGQVAEISYVMAAAARALAGATGGKTVAVLLGQDARALADGLAADRVVYLDHTALAAFSSDTYQKALAALIEKDQPRAVLLGSTSIGTDVAGGLSVQLGLPLVSSCRSFTADGRFVCQICGGKIMAEGELPGPACLVTMVPGGYKAEHGQGTPGAVTPGEVPDLGKARVQLVNYIEPEAGDVDIAKEAVLISVGRGVQNQDNIVLAEDLAAALGGTVSGSRPVIDQGWLSTSRLVGKSGKKVKPRLYLALGISGAPEHAEAITDSGMVVAINTDPAAPIFNLAQYGAEIDMFDLLEVLTEQVKAARGG